MKELLWGALFLCAGAVAMGADRETRSTPSPLAAGVPFDTVPEMGRIAEADARDGGWESRHGDVPAEHLPGVQAAWRVEWRRVAARLTPDLARSLSRWARIQMEFYRKVSPIDTLTFRIASANRSASRLVLEATVDTLPSHSPVVTRWLKLYLVYDTRTSGLVRIVATIRGERLE
ncbi:MAG: hypothetical protein HY815_06365 [Candidatus Riflebacteria bacterium]|nr:hypothetical protein [Candidatus Riflebacteria bacterium]